MQPQIDHNNYGLAIVAYLFSQMLSIIAWISQEKITFMLSSISTILVTVYYAAKFYRENFKDNSNSKKYKDDGN